MGTPFNDILERLSLTDEEVLAIFALDALEAISGELDHRPEITILDALTAEAAERIGAPILARWLRAGTAPGRPLDLLLSGEFGRFEDALLLRLETAA